MASEIEKIRQNLERRKGALGKVQADLKTARRELKRQQIRRKQLEHALEISKQVGLKTQKELEYHLSNLVSAAIASVFPQNPYAFRIQFVERRGKTECDLFLEREGELIDAMSAAGGGVVDVAALALRIAALSMKGRTVRQILLLDEPFKHLSMDLQGAAEEMLHELAHQVGVQVICNSHGVSAVAFADRVFNVKMKGGFSKIS